METSLHRELKALYAGPSGKCEVRLGRHRIDAVRRGRLIEIQHGSLSAIRRKIADLVEQHRLLVVKPIIVDKHVVQLDAPDGEVLRRRLSPKHGGWAEIFDQLVHVATVFPHPRLTFEFPQVTVEETRYPGHGRRRRWRIGDFVVADQTLVEIRESATIRTAGDLWRLLPVERKTLPAPFDTSHLAQRLGIARWIAQRVAYTLLYAGAIKQVGKRGNARLYNIAQARRKTRAA